MGNRQKTTNGEIKGIALRLQHNEFIALGAVHVVAKNTGLLGLNLLSGLGEELLNLNHLMSRCS